jgi:hypothetical protein
MFLSDHWSGAQTSVFTNDIDSLKAVLGLHGIHPLTKHSIDQCHDALIYHLLNGACVDHHMDGHIP